MAAIDKLPRFFIVFSSHFSSKSLLIPSSYHEHLPRRLPKTATLMGTGGRIWKVAMLSKRDQVYFDKGWEKFVEDNDVKDGEVLIFVFDGDQSYQVITYGGGGFKETRAAIHVEEISDDTESDNSVYSLDSLLDIPEVEVQEISDGTESDNSLDSLLDITPIEVEEIRNETESGSDYSPDSGSDYSPDSGSDNSPDSGSDNSPEVANTTTASRNRSMRTIENPEAYLGDPNNIFFETSLKNRKYELLVDTWLVKDNGLKFGDTIDYIDEYGKLTAKLASWVDQGIKIKRWKAICNRNKLTKNDSILCEIFRTSRSVVYAIKIHIIRGGAAAENT